jgi:hypothetical protein
VDYPHTAYSACVAATSPDGSLTIGHTTVHTGSMSIQFGVSGSEASNSSGSVSGGGFIVPATDSQTLVAAPAQVPGGLLGLMCPSNVSLVSALCNTAVNNGLNDVTATAELAGTPADFNLSAGLRTGEPILTLPVKIHLQNPLLGSGCYIGSDQEPIVLHPETTVAGKLRPIDGRIRLADSPWRPPPNDCLPAPAPTSHSQQRIRWPLSQHRSTKSTIWTASHGRGSRPRPRGGVTPRPAR